MKKEIGIEYMKTGDLTPSDYNPRIDLQEEDKEFQALKKSIQKFGFIDPIIYNEQTDRIVGGHQRWKVAKSIGLKKVPVVKIDVPEEQEKILNVGLNKLGGDFDEDKLAGLLSEIEHLGDDLLLTGFEDFEIDALITSIEVNQENTLSGLDEFMDDDEEETEEEAEDDEEHTFTLADGYVKYQIPCTKEERELITEAVKKAKEMLGTDLSNEALAYVAEFFTNNASDSE